MNLKSVTEIEFRSPSGSTDECVTGVTAYRSKESGGSFLRLVPPVPSADELYKRLVALAQPAEEGVSDFPTISAEEFLMGRYDPDLVARPFVVLSAEEPACGQAEDRVAKWLDAPNPALGDECPRVLLGGDEKQRERLAMILSALEQGVFS